MTKDNRCRPKIIMGIDPGIADTGYGFIAADGGELELIAYGTIKTHKSSGLGERLSELEKQLSKLIDEYRPEIAVIEQLFFCNNAKTALIVGQARGVALLTAYNAGLKIFELTPLQVKQGITGYGGADKKQVQAMVKIILKLKETPKPDDAADALAMAICGSSIKNYDL
ncbi:MAG: crossover junction endodeoxyribonuclease RuvC [Patescibacteria group bacterium]